LEPIRISIGLEQLQVAFYIFPNSQEQRDVGEKNYPSLNRYIKNL
jgi:hypothetical protein